MPSNMITINGGWREYVVPDSKMPEVVKCLNLNGSHRGICPHCETAQERKGVCTTETIKDVEVVVNYLKCMGCGETFEDPAVEDNPVERACKLSEGSTDAEEGEE